MDFALDIGKAALGAFHALFGAGRGLARTGEGFERYFRGAIGLGHQGFGGSQRVGCGLAVLLGKADLVDQRVALLGKQRGRVVEGRTFGGHLGDARLHGLDLRGSALLAVLPIVALGQNRLDAAIGKLRLAGQRLCLGADLRGKPAMAVDLGADRSKLALGVEACRQFEKRCGGVLMRALGLHAVGGEAAARFGQRRAARGMTVDLALGRRMTLARGIGLALGGAPGFPRGSLGCCGSLLVGLSRLQCLPLGGGIEAGLFEFVLDVDETGALGQPACRAGRGMRSGDKAVPAPDVAFQRHQPLAGLELRHQLGAAFLGDDADLGGPRHDSSAGACTWLASASTPSGSAGSWPVALALVQRIGADGSTGASRSSPSTAPIAFS